MDETICPECGRPNLIEAEKCWYCQVPLINKESLPDETSGSHAEQLGEENANTKSASLEDNEENLPEWLKRIRELKKADTPVEELDEWRQEKLFPGLTPDAENPAGRSEPLSRTPRGHEKIDPKPVIPDEQPTLEDAPVESDTADQQNMIESAAQDEEEPDNLDDELPEGFTPLER